MIDSERSAASQPFSQVFAGSIPSRQSGMVQPVVEEEGMLATVHAAGSSLFGLFMYNLRFDTFPDAREAKALIKNATRGCGLRTAAGAGCLAQCPLALALAAQPHRNGVRYPNLYRR